MLKKSLYILEYISKNWEEWQKRQTASANPHSPLGEDRYDVSDIVPNMELVAPTRESPYLGSNSREPSGRGSGSPTISGEFNLADWDTFIDNQNAIHPRPPLMSSTPALVNKEKELSIYSRFKNSSPEEFQKFANKKKWGRGPVTSDFIQNYEVANDYRAENPGKPLPPWPKETKKSVIDHLFVDKKKWKL